MSVWLRSALLVEHGIAHGFGTRDAVAPEQLVRPTQVHGCVVAHVEGARSVPAEADAIVAESAQPVGVVTADCVPILVASEDGRGAVAIHGGWRGLAAGVVEAGVAALRARVGEAPLLAAIGPHVGPCCYEVDEPVLAALERNDPELRPLSTRASRPGHVWLDLQVPSRRALARAGVTRIDVEPAECTACGAERFYSVRRDGADTGRLVHWVQPRDASYP